MQANYLRTQPVSSNEASPLCSSSPRSMGRGAVRRAYPEPAGGQRMQLSSRDGVGSAYHCPRQGHGLNDLLGPGNQSKAESSSSRGLSRENGRRKQGVRLSYVTSFLGVRGPGLSQPSTAGRGVGRPRRLWSPPLLPLLQTSQTSKAGTAFQVPRLQAGTSR